MTADPGDGGEGLATGGQGPGAGPPTARPGVPGDAEVVAEALDAVERQAGIDRTVFVAEMLDEEASPAPFASQVRPPGEPPAGGAAIVAAESEQVISDFLEVDLAGLTGGGAGRAGPPAANAGLLSSPPRNPGWRGSASSAP